MTSPQRRKRSLLWPPPSSKPPSRPVRTNPQPPLATSPRSGISSSTEAEGSTESSTDLRGYAGVTDARWQVLDWRRQVADLYRSVRRERDPRVAHATWVEGRNGLLSRHSASPVPESERATYPGANVAPYDGDYRFVVGVDRAVREVRRDVPTATDGVVPLERVGRGTLPALGALDVWWAAVYGGGIFLPVRDATSAKQSLSLIHISEPT